jgi:hypothetical protein
MRFLFCAGGAQEGRACLSRYMAKYASGHAGVRGGIQDAFCK